MSIEEDELVSAPFSLAAWRSIARFFAPHVGLIVKSLALMVVCSVIDVLIPIYQRWLIDEFIMPRSSDGIWGAAALGAALIAAQSVGTLIFTRAAIRIEMRVSRDLKRACFDKLQTLSISFYSTTPVGRLIARVMSDTDKIGLLIAWGLVDAMWGISYVIFALVSMIALDVRLGLASLAIVPLMGAATYIFQRKIIERNREVRAINAAVTAAFNEGIGGAKTSKTLANESVVLGGMRGVTEDMRAAAIREKSFSALYMPVMLLIASCAVAMIVSSGGARAAAAAIPIGTLSAMISYALNIFQPLQSLSRFLTEAASTQVNAERVLDLLEREPEVADSPEVVARYGDSFEPRRENWEPMRGDVEFDDVSFTYPGGEQVLDHFSLKIAAGQTVALVGETGAGKTTIVDLVCRFYEPDSGRVLIDGRDARERSQLWLRSHIGYVLQSPHLFSGTIRDNVRFGREGATDEDILEAMRTVSADRLLARLPQGLDTEVGEGGGMLSTGEKQLISFARAVLADPRLFVFDEATSSVDSDTELAIQQAASASLAGRTSFVIAHRLSTVTNADLILVVDDGKIVERGTHEELLAARGRYAELWEAQFDDFD